MRQIETRLNVRIKMVDVDEILGVMTTPYLAEIVMLIVLEETASDYLSGLTHTQVNDKLRELIGPRRIVWYLDADLLPKLLEPPVIAEVYNTMRWPTYQERIAVANPLLALGGGDPWLWYYPFHDYNRRARDKFRAEFERCDRLFDVLPTKEKVK
jgi:hypothetical protein